jgi:hypothetical protein
MFAICATQAAVRTGFEVQLYTAINLQSPPFISLQLVMDYVLLSVPNKYLFSVQNTCSFHLEISSINAFTYREE